MIKKGIKKTVKKSKKKTPKKVVKKATSKKKTVKKKNNKTSKPKAKKSPSIQSPSENNIDLTTPVKRKRGRRKKTPSNKMYFTKETEKAIILYNKEENSDIRNEIYNEKIKYAFEKLVENVLNTFKFSYFDCGPLDVQKETLSHLVSNMDKYEEHKGKAFSYFSIIAKNYLIFHNNNNFKKYNQHVDITEERETDSDHHSVRLQSEDKHHYDVQNKEFLNLMIDFWDDNIHKIFKKQRDVSIANAVVELFRNIDKIDAFNKKALYLYIREISSCKTQQITKVINKMKSHQKQLIQNYINEGKID